MIVAVDDYLAGQLGKTTPGGCDDCDAEQEITQDPSTPGLFVLNIRHDDTCPYYRQIRRQKRRRR